MRFTYLVDNRSEIFRTKYLVILLKILVREIAAHEDTVHQSIGAPQLIQCIVWDLILQITHQALPSEWVRALSNVQLLRTYLCNRDRKTGRRRYPHGTGLSKQRMNPVHQYSLQHPRFVAKEILSSGSWNIFADRGPRSLVRCIHFRKR